MKGFSQRDAYGWFERHGVPLVTQEDQCVFPASQDSHTIINCFLGEARRHGIEIKTGHRINSLDELSGYDYIAVTTGGSPKAEGLQWLADLGHEITVPVPSLFTFRIDDQRLHSLMGTVAEEATAQFPGTKLKGRGPLLITHWGMSGPAILKTSSQAARHLADNAYKANLLVDWWPAMSQDEVMAFLSKLVKTNGAKQVSTIAPPPLTHRHWAYLIGRIGISETKRWNEIGKKDFNRMVQLLKADTYAVDGKGQFKDEFVTCGGVALSELDPNTLECKKHPRLYFAGEVTDVDAVTGGFNLQAAWTMGYVVAQAVANKDNQD